MKIAQKIKLGAWLLIGLNLIMAFGSIWVFIRMSPAIEIIIEQNEHSLQACEEMLSNLALANQHPKEVRNLKTEFEKALMRAKNNITEKKEPQALEAISKNYIQAFNGDIKSNGKTISAIRSLSQINRLAMERADLKARQLGTAGAWGIVFMASVIFMGGMIFIRSINRSLVKPLEEIHSVIQAVKTRDNMRRCIGRPDTPPDIQRIFENLNEILDQNTLSIMNKKR